MKSDLVLIAAIGFLGLLGIVIVLYHPEQSKILYAVVGIIAAIAGVTGQIVIPRAVRQVRLKLKK